MKFSDLKVGQKVKLKTFEEMKKYFKTVKGQELVSETRYTWGKYCGRTVTVSLMMTNIRDKYFRIEEDNEKYTWHIEDISLDKEKLELI